MDCNMGQLIFLLLAPQAVYSLRTGRTTRCAPDHNERGYSLSAGLRQCRSGMVPLHCAYGRVRGGVAALRVRKDGIIKSVPPDSAHLLSATAQGGSLIITVPLLLWHFNRCWRPAHVMHTAPYCPRTCGFLQHNPYFLHVAKPILVTASEIAFYAAINSFGTSLPVWPPDAAMQRACKELVKVQGQV